MALAEGEVFGTVVPGFITDAAGSLVTTATWDDTVLGTVVPGFLTDVDGRLIVNTDDTDAAMSGGFWRDPDGALVVVTDNTDAIIDAGFLRSPDGYLVIVVDPETVSQSYLTPGFFTDADNLLATTTPDDD